MQSDERNSSDSTVCGYVESPHVENQMNPNDSYVSNLNFDEIWFGELEEIDMLADITHILSAVRLGLLEDHFRRDRSGTRLRGGGGGNRNGTEDDTHSKAASETQLSVLLKKIEAIESKVRLLLKKATQQSDSAPDNQSAAKPADALYEKIEVYKAKLAKCEEKKRKLERSMRKSEKSVESMKKSSKLLKELNSVNDGDGRRYGKAHKVTLANFSPERNTFSDNQAAVIRKTENNASDNAFKLNSSYSAILGEDQMCQKMYQARFKNFSLKNMGFYYNRFRTYEYYKSGVLDYIETQISDTEKRLDVRLNFTMGKYHYNRAEVRFKRMDNFLRSHMIYYSYRTGQQIADRIVAETWKSWFPKRFYMPYDYYVDTSYKTNFPFVGGLNTFAQDGYYNVRNWPKRYYAAHIFRPICIPIPPGTIREAQLPTWPSGQFGFSGFHSIEFLHTMARYCFGAKDVWDRKKKSQKKLTNYWVDVVILGGVANTNMALLANLVAFGELMRKEDPPLTYEYTKSKDKFGRPLGWSSDLVQGFNVKKLDEIKMSDPKFKELYEKWGEIHKKWLKLAKIRSDQTPYY